MENQQPTYQPESTPGGQTDTPEATEAPASVSTSSKVGLISGVIGIISAIVSIFFVPPAFGIIGIILGAISVKKGKKSLGVLTIILSIVLAIVGSILGAYSVIS